MSENEHRLVNPSLLPPVDAPQGPAEPDVPGPSNDVSQSAKSRRRRRAADAEPQPKNQSFYFVDSTSSSKEKRAHVMRHHVQEKKKQRKLSHGNLQVDLPPDSTTWPARKDSGYGTDNRKVTAVTSAPGPTSAGQDYSHHSAISTAKPPFQPTTALSHMESPMTMLDASRKDPFSSLPMVQDPEDLDLVDYWTTKLTYWSGQNPYVKNQIFRTAMEHPVSFQSTVLAYCARWKAQLYGLTDSKDVQRHVTQARKNIEDALVGSVKMKEDQLAMAMAGMALQEQRFGCLEDAQRYLEEAVRIMRPRTGSNTPVEVFLHYMRYLTPPPSIIPDPANQQWLVTFLRGAHDLMREHSSPDYHIHTPQRLEAFQMERPLFALLSSGPRPTQVPHASRMYVVRDAPTQEVCRTAALIYITAALWDFKDSPPKTGRFLTYICAVIEHHQLDRHPACETLLWLLLEQGCDPDLRDPERAWAAGELLKAHKQLPPDLQFQFNELLMSFLSLRPPIRGIDVFEKELQESTRSSSLQ
ncbi:hypothetical protein N7462_004821 [Penicillium macrosclerotiorum]|uniref:uncharacterized protein n=1 Tax=Penicillium macrosclerotiorum TaxID=303699 RepID=UPI0025476F7A|nr:uncharacterized protein N7462_004821 [Penicillium macrosclerotiorum]KAJ5690429.1 hypothetical protein N7462_004821 [Penicillium macrosclerotiorum]